MKVGILGSGDVGQALGRGLVARGHEVKMGSREKNNEKAARWAKEEGARASSGDFGEAARDLEPLCTLWLAYGMKTKSWGHAFKLLRK